jgi:hypothetical protein
MHMDHSGGTGSPFTAQTIGDSTLGADHDARHNGGDRQHARTYDGGSALPSHIASIVAENHELRAEVERLRAERARMADIQTRLMEAVGCKSPERLVHDVRNVLNERELYRALADTIQD